MNGDGASIGLTNGSDEPEKRRRGRPKGIPNRATRDVRVAAGKYTARALTALARLLSDDNPKVRAIAARELLDRAHGKPSEHRHTELTGKDGAPLQSPGEDSDLDTLRRVRFILNKAKRGEGANDEGGAEPPEPRALPEPEPFGVAQAASEHQAESWRLHAEAQEQRRQRPWSDPDYRPPLR